VPSSNNRDYTRGGVECQALIQKKLNFF